MKTYFLTVTILSIIIVLYPQNRVSNASILGINNEISLCDTEIGERLLFKLLKNENYRPIVSDSRNWESEDIIRQEDCTFDKKGMWLSHGTAWDGIRKSFYVPRDALAIETDGKSDDRDGQIAIFHSSYTFSYTYGIPKKDDPLEVMFLNSNWDDFIDQFNHALVQTGVKEEDATLIINSAITNLRKMPVKDRMLQAIQTSGKQLQAEIVPQKAVEIAILLCMKAELVSDMLSIRGLDKFLKIKHLVLRSNNEIIFVPAKMSKLESGKDKAEYYIFEYGHDNNIVSRGILVTYSLEKQGIKPEELVASILRERVSD